MANPYGAITDCDAFLNTTENKKCANEISINKVCTGCKFLNKNNLKTSKSSKDQNTKTVIYVLMIICLSSSKVI